VFLYFRQSYVSHGSALSVTISFLLDEEIIVVFSFTITYITHSDIRAFRAIFGVADLLCDKDLWILNLD
jgi:hypothetical protein